MSVDRRLLNWGLFFILVGAVPLLVQQGAISRDAVAESWRIWPLILIGIGIGILLRRTPFRVAGGLIVAGTFGIWLGALFAVGPAVSVGCGSGNTSAGTATSSQQGSLQDGGRVRVTMDCGTLHVTSAPGNAWSLQARDPQEDSARIDQGSDHLTVQARQGGDFFSSIARLRSDRDWQLSLPADSRLDVSVDVNAGSGQLDLGSARLSHMGGSFNAADVHVDLSGASVQGMDLSFNAGSGSLALPATSSFSGSLDVNAASVNICAPSGVGLRFTVGGALASTDFSGAGLTHSGDTWTSPDYQTAVNRIDLHIDANAASVSLSRSGECR